MDAEKKDDLFRLPEMNNLHFGRQISTVQVPDAAFSVLQVGRGRQTAVLLCRFDRDGRKEFFQGPEGTVYQPTVAASADQVHVAWNEFKDGQWLVCYSSLSRAAAKLTEPEIICRTPALCQPPVITMEGDSPCCAFITIDHNRSRINLARREPRGGWQLTATLAAADGDCFRPSLSWGDGQLYLAWDQYRHQTYQVVLARVHATRIEIIARLQGPGQRWLKPKTVTAPDGTVYLCWLVLQAVTDKLGIVDHHPYIMAARRQPGQLEYLTDQDNRDNPYLIGDLREGQLAAEIYKGHVGLRRNPQLSLDRQQNLWLWWEMRPETKGSDVVGHLVGRKMLGPGRWTEPAVFCRNGYCYAMPPRIPDREAALTCYHFESKNLDLIKNQRISPDSGEKLVINPLKWRRWKQTAITPPAKPATTVKLADGDYKMVWADTHCHSNFSPDAEGELDEIVNFARDAAGLDVISVIDNDYYPHKALTEAEWLTQGQMAEHYTRGSGFVWLPGYEFTYHRSDLKPDFNHRCVIYPRAGGRLLRRIDPESRTDEQLIAGLSRSHGMAYPHHCSYRLIDPAVEWNIEACSSWRVCLEETTFTMNLLQAGAVIGFIGSSDTHRTVPGMGGARTGLYVTELTPEALFEAYRRHRTIATQGFNIFIDFRVDTGFIGEHVQTTGPPNVRGRIREAPEKIDYVEVIRDGEVVWWDQPAAAGCDFCYQDRTAAPGRHFYILKLKLHGDPSLNVDAVPADNYPKPFEQNSRYPHNLARAQGVFAWTSPIWLDYVT